MEWILLVLRVNEIIFVISVLIFNAPLLYRVYSISDFSNLQFLGKFYEEIFLNYQQKAEIH
jgi:hypothetical protein